MPPPPEIDALGLPELKSLVLELLAERAEFQRTISALRDEIARLKGGPGRPDIKANVKPDDKPSGMEKASRTPPSEGPGKQRRRGSTRTKLKIDEERDLKADAPTGSRFKGYASYLIQDLIIRPHVIEFHRECWQAPDGKVLRAPLPAGVDGHFGPELRRFVLAQYHQGQVTAARLVTLLRGLGIVISKRQVVRLLIAVIVSDDAGQFNVGKHGLCWVHAERLVHKLDTFTDAQRAAQSRVRRLIWLFYRSLKAWRLNPSPARKVTLSARFDRIFSHKTGYATLDRLLKRLRANKHELLMVLERPEIPLHTNGSENDIRCQVTKRAISGGTRSDAGRDCRDAFLALLKTCAKNGIAFWDYLGARLDVQGAKQVPALVDLVSANSPQPP